LQESSAEFRTPAIEPAPGLPRAVTAVALDPTGRHLAVGRFGEVELLRVADRSLVARLDGPDAKVNSLAFSADGLRLVAASGIAGFRGEARIWSLVDGSSAQVMPGHRDTMYAASLSPDGRLLATAGYDRRIILSSSEDGRPLRELNGHNDAIYDLKFSPCGSVVASASGDATIKLWKVDTGDRLDTLGQPDLEQYAVAFRPDGRHLVAAGADRRLRVWEFVSIDAPAINPLLHTRVAHEGAVVALAFSQDGTLLATAAEDRTIKIWETHDYTVRQIIADQPDLPVSLAMAPDGRWVAVGRMDGSWDILPTSPEGPSAAARSDSRIAAQDHAVPQSKDVRDATDAVVPAATNEPPATIEEREPNSVPAEAQAIDHLPATIRGVVDAPAAGESTDSDLFRLDSAGGETWVIEVRAARDKSPLDSVVEVLHADGRPVQTGRLQAVRDSYLTFRGKDSTQSSDFRLHNWEEMEPNDYLYVGGEVIRLFQYPRGPDSGFWVYPGRGSRWTYFGTTAVAHAFQEPCYIVRTLAEGAEPIPNGLPLFPVYARNDDEAMRRWGHDSQLFFTAPQSGTYLVRLTDARGFQGADYRYELTIRRPNPDFRVTLEGVDPAVGAGSGRGFTVTVERIDGFDGEVRIDIDGVPEGFTVITPLVIEPGHQSAHGVLFAESGVAAPGDESAGQSRLTATAVINEVEVQREVGSLGKIRLDAAPKLTVELTAESGELHLEPGQSIAARLLVHRNGFDDRVSCEAFNLPHGVYVENIGLNGILIVEGQSEREIFIKASPWVLPTRRPFYLQANVEGNQASRPVMLRIQPGEPVASR
jgi:WD40 repeat protein